MHLWAPLGPSLSLSLTLNSKGNGGRGRKREGLQENWEKVQVLQIPRGVGVVLSRVIRDEDRN